MAINLLLGITGTVCLLVLLYLVILAIASLLPEKRIHSHSPRSKFCIVIPAHDEAENIGTTLDILKMVNYPEHLYDIIVIADNCHDHTTTEVHKRKIKWMERKNDRITNKGIALKWAFSHLIKSTTHDAFVVIDADTHMDPNFLTIMNNCLSSGQKVIQGYSQVRNPQRSLLESLSFLGFALNRNLKYRGRSRLKLCPILMGTGMCIAREVIEQFGWPACSLVEDVEFTMFLKIHGINVFFAEKARLTVELHTDILSTKRQRLRWDLGKLEIKKRYLRSLIHHAFLYKDISCLDCAMELLLPPFPILFVIITGGGVLSIIAKWANICSPAVLSVWLSNTSLIILYTIAGLISAKAPPKVYKALLYAPLIVMWRSWIVLRESFNKNRNTRW